MTICLLPLNVIDAKEKESFLDMSVCEFVRTTRNCIKLFEIQF